MKVEENFYYAVLFDAYGPLLSCGQKQVLEDYLNENLTATEISENNGISRQAVKDSIDKALKKLENFENKLHMVKKLENLKKENQALKEKVMSLKGEKNGII